MRILLHELKNSKFNNRKYYLKWKNDDDSHMASKLKFVAKSETAALVYPVAYMSSVYASGRV